MTGHAETSLKFFGYNLCVGELGGRPLRPILKRREGDLANDKEVEASPEAASAQNADGVADADGEEGKWDGVLSVSSKYFMS